MNSSQFDLLYEITVRGYHPVVAHPERNLVLQHHPELLKEFLEYHVVLQITAQVLAATTLEKLSNASSSGIRVFEISAILNDGAKDG
jgi:protein-tyrosine phosphatase